MITYTLLAIMALYSIYAFRDPKVMGKYLFHPYSIYHHGEHYRFLSHAFIHGDGLHLMLNGLALYGFGLALEDYYFPLLFGEKTGKLMYLLLFTGGIYAASLTEYFRQRHKMEYRSLGASGAISSVLFCFIVLSPGSKVALFFIPMPGWLAGALLLGTSLYLIRRKRLGTYQDNISHESHFWGALFGIAFILIAKPAVLGYFLRQVFGL